ncbi:MAG: polyhydroxyalkanoate synthesis protein PhaF [Actinomycetes bacterium]
MLNDLRTYLQLATGVTEATAAKAREVVTGLVTQGINLTSKVQPVQDVADQVQELADELVETSRTNRELLVGMIRSEVDKAVGRMGFVREDELAALRRHVQRLETELEDMRSHSQAAVPVAEPAAATGAQDSKAETPKAKKKIRLVEEGQ